MRPEFFYSFVTSDCQGKVNPIEQRSEKKGSIPFCAGNFMSKIHGNGFAPFRFLTPFPHRPPQVISEGQWVEKTVWKAERAWFLDRRGRRAKPGIEPFLTRWGKSGVFSESAGLSFLKHTRRPISSASLDGRFGKAKSSRSLQPFPCIFLHSMKEKY